MSMEYILSQITNENEKEVFKSMRTDMNTNAALLNPEQFNQFMRAATIDSTILSDASFRRMNSMKQVVSSTKIVGRVLQDGYDANGDTEDELNAATIGFGKAELNAHKLKALTGILDDDKEDNIEREQFEQTLLTMMGEAIGTDLEAICVFGDTTKSGFFGTYDGWIKQSNTLLKSSELGTTANTRAFNVHDNTIEAMFDAMIRALPVAYRQSKLLKDLVFYVPYEVFDAYVNLLKSRNTSLGDSFQTGAPQLSYKNIPIKYAPVLDAADGRTSLGYVPAILTIPEFLWYGVYKDLSVEPDRKVAQERTDYYYRIRCDAGLQWNDAVIIAGLTDAETALIQDEAKQ